MSRRGGLTAAAGSLRHATGGTSQPRPQPGRPHPDSRHADDHDDDTSASERSDTDSDSDGGAPTDDSDSDGGASDRAREREAQRRREAAEAEEATRRRRRLALAQPTQPTQPPPPTASRLSTTTAVQPTERPRGTTPSGVTPLSLPKPGAGVAGTTTSTAASAAAAAAAAAVDASSSCVVLPCTVHPVRSTPLVAYLGSASAHSSTNSTPIPHTPALGRALAHVSQEVHFNDVVPLAFLTFRNFYVSHLTIKQMVVKVTPGDRDGRAKQVWTTILHRHTLMHYPHAEGEAQKQWTLSVDQFNSKFDPSNLHRLRFDYYQSSPNWRSFHLLDLQTWAVARPAKDDTSKDSSRRGTSQASRDQSDPLYDAATADALLSSFSSPSSSAASRLISSSAVRQRLAALISTLQSQQQV